MEDKQSSLMGGMLAGSVTWLVAGGLLLFSWNRLPPEVPLLYSLPAGETQLVTKAWVVVAWGGTGAVMWLNVILAYWVAAKEKLLQKYLVWGGAIVQILFLMSLWRVLQVIL